MDVGLPAVRMAKGFTTDGDSLVGDWIGSGIGDAQLARVVAEHTVPLFMPSFRHRQLARFAADVTRLPSDSNQRCFQVSPRQFRQRHGYGER